MDSELLPITEPEVGLKMPDRLRNGCTETRDEVARC
jgi:hypothetical protein